MVCIEEGVLRDAIVAEGVAQRGAKHQLGGVVIIHYVDMVRLLHLQVGITVFDGRRIAAVHVWVEVGDAWTNDAQIVVHTNVHASAQRIGEGGIRYDGTIVLLEILAVALLECYFLPGMLVSSAQLGAQVPKLSVPFCVGGKDALLVLVFHTVVGVQSLVLVSVNVVVLGVRLVDACDELSAEIQFLSLAERFREVCLECVLRTPGSILGEEVVECDARNSVLVFVKTVFVVFCWVGAE
mgnify:CR=1 FL=1